MSEYEMSRGMPATSEIVFGVASDPYQLTDWLPEHLAVRPEAGNRVHVESDASGGHEAEGLFSANANQLRIEWAEQGTDAYAGWLQVADADGGASEATLHLSFADDAPPAHRLSDKEIERWMSDALDRLAHASGSRGQNSG